MLQCVANYLHKPLEEIEEKHLINERSQTFFRKEVAACALQACWDECIRTSQFYTRKDDIIQFNR